MAQPAPTSLAHYYTLAVKIFEAHSIAATPIDSFVTYHFGAAICLPNAAVARTPVVYAAVSPFYAESFVLSHANDYDVLQFALWELEAGIERLIGKLVLSRSLVEAGLLEVETWFPLLPVSTRDFVVQGEVRIRLEYFEPTTSDDHTYFVTICGVRNLVLRDGNFPPCPYVVAHLLPDESATSTKTSAVAELQCNATFDDCISYRVASKHPHHEIHVSVWHSCDNPEQDEFLGQFRMPLSDVAPGDIVENWYPLLPRPEWFTMSKIRNRSNSKLVRRSLSDMLGKPRSVQTERIKYPPKDLILAIYRINGDGKGAGRNPHKFVDHKSESISICAHCGNILWTNRLHQSCKQCHVAVHWTCMKYTLNNCSQIPAIRLYVKHEEIKALPWLYYKPMITVLRKNNYFLTHSIQQDREVAAMCLIKIFTHENCVIDFVKCLIDIEVNSASDTPTLFRGNSMTSKVMDSFMKFTAKEYLSQVLSGLIRYIISRSLACEVDPTRMEKSDDMRKNWKTLLEVNNKICDLIFKSTSLFPIPLRMVFAHLQTASITRFPTEINVRYTAVSGFIFLRFFAAAVLGPRLFGLWDNSITRKVARTLTLCAKTLQNLANLVPFGAKEPYMVPMNELLTQHYGHVKSFIDDISTPPVDSYVMTERVTEEEAAKECSLLCTQFEKEIKKMLADAVGDKPKLAILKEFSTVLTEITTQTTTGILSKPLTESSTELISSQTLTLPQSPDLSKFLSSLSPTNTRGHRVSTGNARITNRNNSVSSSRSPRRQIKRVHKNSVGFMGSLRMNNKISVRRKTLHQQSNGTGSSPSLRAGDNESSVALPLSTKFCFNLSSALLPEHSISKASINDMRVATPVVLVSGTSNRDLINSLGDISSMPSMELSSDNLQMSKSLSDLSNSSLSTPADPFAFFDTFDSELDQLISNSTPTSPNSIATTTVKNPSTTLDINQQSKLPISKLVKPPPAKPNTSQASMLALLNMAVSAIDKGIANNAPPQDQFRSCETCHRFVVPASTSRLPASGPVENIGPNPEREAVFENRVWHQACFVCCVCGDELSLDIATYYKQKLYCVDDFKQHEDAKQVACGRCGKAVSGQTVKTGDQIWHRECLTCEVCNVSVVDGYMVSHDRILCKPDFVKQEELVCGVCGDPIYDEFVEVHARKFHSHCKVCQLCKEPMVNREFFSLNDEDEVYCMSHYSELACCAECQQPLEDETIVIALASQRRFHPQHFNCVRCGLNLADLEFYELDDRAYCYACYFQLI